MLSLSFITPWLATSGHLNQKSDVDKLFERGVTHVLDLQLGTQDSLWLNAHPEIFYFHNGTADDGERKPTSWFAASLAFAREALPDHFGPFLPGDPEPPKTDHKLLCHCSAGYNRGPSTCFFLLRVLGWTPWQAKAAIWWHRPITLFGGLSYVDDAEAALKDLGLSDQPSPDVWS